MFTTRPKSPLAEAVRYLRRWRRSSSTPAPTAFDSSLVLIRSTQDPRTAWHQVVDPHSGLPLDLLRCVVGACVLPASRAELASRIRTDAFSAVDAKNLFAALELLVSHELLVRRTRDLEEVFVVHPSLARRRTFSPVAQAIYAVCQFASSPKETFTRVDEFLPTTHGSVQSILANLAQRGYLRVVTRAAYARPLDAAKHAHPAYSAKTSTPSSSVTPSRVSHQARFLVA